MNRTIWEFAFALSGKVSIESPEVRQWLTVAVQDGQPMVWVVVEPRTRVRRYHLHIRGTGHPMDGVEGRFIGTLFTDPGLVFHVFEDVLGPEEI